MLDPRGAGLEEPDSAENVRDLADGDGRCPDLDSRNARSTRRNITEPCFGFEPGSDEESDHPRNSKTALTMQNQHAKSWRRRRGKSSPALGTPGSVVNTSKDRRIRQLRFNLEMSPTRRLENMAIKKCFHRPAFSLWVWAVVGCISIVMSTCFCFVFSLIFGEGRGVVQMLIWKSVTEGTLTLSEALSNISMICCVGLIAAVFAKVSLDVYANLIFGMQAIRKSRRLIELDAKSPFHLHRTGDEVDDSLLEYLQTHYDSGPFSVLAVAAATPSGDSGGFLVSPPAENSTTTAVAMRPRSVSLVSSASSRRPSCTPSLVSGQRSTDRARRSSETHRACVEYMTLEQHSTQGACATNGSSDDEDVHRPGGFPQMSREVSVIRNHGTCDENHSLWHKASAINLSGDLIQQDFAKLQELTWKLPDWNFDIFEVADATPRPLSFIGFVCLDAFSKLVDMDKGKLIEFLNAVEGSYREVPYHNKLHGASVARCVYSFCAGCGLAFQQECMEFTIVLAGLVHDVHHPGLTQTFLSKASMDGPWVSPICTPLEEADMELSLKYNDQSPLENMHCAITFELLTKENTAFLAKEEIAAMRKPLIRAILGTDMAKHAETMIRLAALIDNLKHQSDTGSVPWHWPAKPPTNADEEQRMLWERLYQEEFVMELFLHAADIGTPTLPFDQWVRWNALVQEEFHEQGDREYMEFGELISPPAGFDRAARPKAEHAFTKGFMQYLSLPLFEQLHELSQVVCPASVCQGVRISGCLTNLKKNIELWDKHPPRRDDSSDQDE